MKNNKKHSWIILKKILLILCFSISAVITAQNPGSNVTISFIQSGERPAVIFTSGTTVYEEAMENGQLVGLYWSASGYIQRENVSVNMPGYNNWKNYPNNSFELEIDG
jgi:hypothetical protein